MTTLPTSELGHSMGVAKIHGARTRPNQRLEERAAAILVGSLVSLYQAPAGQLAWTAHPEFPKYDSKKVDMLVAFGRHPTLAHRNSSPCDGFAPTSSGVPVAWDYEGGCLLLPAG